MSNSSIHLFKSLLLLSPCIQFTAHFWPFAFLGNCTLLTICTIRQYCYLFFFNLYFCTYLFHISPGSICLCHSYNIFIRTFVFIFFIYKDRVVVDFYTVSFYCCVYIDIFFFTLCAYCVLCVYCTYVYWTFIATVAPQFPSLGWIKYIFIFCLCLVCDLNCTLNTF